MRKSHIVCFALAALLMGAATSSGATTTIDIRVYVYADSGDPSESDRKTDSGSVTATQNDTYDWAYSLFVSAYASVRGSGYATSSAYADASVSGAVSCFIDAYDDTPALETGEEVSASDSGTMDMVSGTKIDLDGEVSAAANWFSGSAQCRGIADSEGSVSLTLN